MTAKRPKMTAAITFDHVNVKSARETLSSMQYPEVEYNMDFPNTNFKRVYGDAARFYKHYYGINELLTNANILPTK